MRPDVFFETDHKITIGAVPNGADSGNGWLVILEQKVIDPGTGTSETLQNTYLFWDWAHLVEFLSNELL